MRNLNLVGPQVRRLRSRREWSQSQLAIKLQLLGMENATRVKVAKIESRLVCVADEDMIFLARALSVSLTELFPDFILSAKKVYEAISQSKASRFGSFIIGFLCCSVAGTAATNFSTMLATV
jgi:transcriptional regulator with XRE-family HTH domain